LDGARAAIRRPVRLAVVCRTIAMTRLHSCFAWETLIRGLRGLESRRRRPDHGRQGKRPAFGAAYVVGWTRQFTDITDTPCWRFRRFPQRIQCPERHRTAESSEFWR
jgi:hypothetical protein